jgi:predicted deacetylase
MDRTLAYVEEGRGGIPPPNHPSVGRNVEPILTMKDVSFPALASVHDLMPETIDRVDRIVGRLRQKNVFPVALLVVPGKPWKDHDLEKIHQWVAEGYTLVAHGWHHWGPPQSLWHHIHSVIISRNEAEHLSKSSQEVKDLMQRSHDWFVDNGFPAPEVYIPPTWALGSLNPSDLQLLPYRCIETQLVAGKCPSRIRMSLNFSTCL